MPAPHELEDFARLWDMVRYGRELVGFVQGLSFSEAMGNKILVRALERDVEVIGEAARHVSDAGRALAPQLPWGAIVAQRHIVAHEYGELMYGKLWAVATVHVPEMLAILTPIVERHSPDLFA
ncbi:hypothetical protein BH11PLA1_BH11PLA1_22360 [soil metagenome]